MPTRSSDTDTPDTPAAPPVAVLPAEQGGQYAETTGGHDLTYAQRIAEEYGQFRAKTALFIDGIRAFNEGDPVPASHQFREQWVKDGMVEPVSKGS